MKISLFEEVAVPRPWTAESESTAFAHRLEEIKLADAIGMQAGTVTGDDDAERRGVGSPAELRALLHAYERIGADLSPVTDVVESMARRDKEREQFHRLRSQGKIEAGE